MAWLKKEEDVEVLGELESESNGISKTNAYTITITEAYLQDSKQQGSKSMSLVINGKTDDDETIKTFFTLTGRDGNTFFMRGPHKVRHMGLSTANTLFGIVLGKEIFSIEPKPIEYNVYNKDTREMEQVTGDGFPDLIGKQVGITAQMIRKISGADSKEYAEITHFFDNETGLFYQEEAIENKPTKLDKWLRTAKEFKVIEEETKQSSFGSNSRPTATQPKATPTNTTSRWGK